MNTVTKEIVEVMYKLVFRLFTAIAIITFLGLPSSIAEAQIKVSKPGEYSGYVSVLYDGWKRFSRYVIAIDKRRPLS